MKEATELEIGGHRARVFDAGEGPPVIVLHGWGGRIESMWPTISCLRSGYRVIGIDLPGFGDSPVPPGVWGTADYAEFVVDLVRSKGIDRAHFLGHSFGAKTSLYIAATRPDVVDRLIVVGASGLTSAPTPKVRAKRAVSKTAKAVGKLGPPGRKFRQAVYDRIASQDYKDAGPMRAVMVKVVNEDIAHQLPRIQSPTLLVWGTEDDAVPVKHAQTMESLIPDSGLVLFEGAGHFAYLDQPEHFCKIATHFFGDQR